MWVVIDESLLNSINSIYTINALEQLTRSFSMGHHAVVGKPIVIKKLKSISGISINTKTILGKIEDKSREYFDIASRASKKIIVNDSDSDSDSEKISEKNGTWAVSVKWINNFGLPRSGILGENLLDVKIFELCIKNYIFIEKSILKKI